MQIIAKIGCGKPEADGEGWLFFILGLPERESVGDAGRKFLLIVGDHDESLIVSAAENIDDVFY